ncbi:hypothetical protein BCV69DRAFT_300649 [Microstroma glucosiphilum]|uniref:Uncharacterized protein n=1 Tax=Pseudomicrostroma glucosiphilum TaxID=1684307 RepID=A0A316U4C7_9BASI|nr:hypothetical protein BCV69DRAFT_300649 [Pseudomicrostroma glucosiphilum]PWN19331.1 hypothetical protein BCV69DRAFT_300649 [Pseudomicrostroma glucosiphilum]
MVVPKAKVPLFLSTPTHDDDQDDSEVDDLASKSPSAQPVTPPSSPPTNRPNRSKKTRRVDEDVLEAQGAPAGLVVAGGSRRAQQPDLNADDPPSDSSQDVTIHRRAEQVDRALRSSTRRAKTPPSPTFPPLKPVAQRAAARKAQQKIAYTAKAETASKRRDKNWNQYDFVQEPSQSSAPTKAKPIPQRQRKPKTSSPSLVVFDERLRALYESRQQAVEVGQDVCRDSGGKPLILTDEARKIIVMICSKCRRNINDPVFSLEIRQYEEYDGKGQVIAPLWRPILINVMHSHPHRDGTTMKHQKRKRRSSDSDSDSDSDSSLTSEPSANDAGPERRLDDTAQTAEQGGGEETATPSSGYFAFADDPPRSPRPSAASTGSRVSEESKGRDTNARTASVPNPPSSNTNQTLLGPEPSPERQTGADVLLRMFRAPQEGPVRTAPPRADFPMPLLLLGDTSVAPLGRATSLRIGTDPRKRPKSVCIMDGVRKSQQWLASTQTTLLSAEASPSAAAAAEVPSSNTAAPSAPSPTVAEHSQEDMSTSGERPVHHETEDDEETNATTTP